MQEAWSDSMPGASDVLCRLFRVTGRVQGVFFRASARTAAHDLGLGGYAKNLPDGSVEVLACGSREALVKFRAWLQQGSPLAAVACVESELRPYRKIDSFTVS